MLRQKVGSRPHWSSRLSPWWARCRRCLTWPVTESGLPFSLMSYLRLATLHRV